MSNPDPFDRAIELQEAGRLAEAEAVCRQIIASQPRHSGALLLLGIIRAKGGDPAEAQKLISRSLGIEPDVPFGHFWHGMVLAQLGRSAEALQSYQRVTELAPDFAQAYYNRGLLLFAMNRFEDALAAFERAIRRQGDLMGARVARAVVLSHLNRRQDEMDELNFVLARQPDFTLALNVRSVLYCELERREEALADSERSLALDPNQSQAHVSRCTALLALRRLPEALAAVNRALELDPDSARALTLRAVVYRETGRYAESLADCERAVSLAPIYDVAHANLGETLMALDQFDRALEAFNRAETLNPQFSGAFHSRAILLRLMGQFELALADSERALAHDPTLAPAASERFYLAGLLCDWRDYAAWADDLARRVREDRKVTPWVVVSALDDPELQRKAAQRAAEPALAAMTAAPRVHERLRIAYLSPDFGDHPLTYQSVELFERHDKTRFETYGVCLHGGPESAIRKRIGLAFEHFVEAGKRSNAEVAELLQSLEIDIAVDLAGYTSNARPGIFSSRPAPLAVSYVGYPSTVGSVGIDYVLADAVTIPPGSERFFIEQVVRLPGCFFPADTVAPREAPPTRTEAGLPETGFVFSAFNNSYKLTPYMFDIWMRLLHAIDGSLLWLSVRNEKARDNLRAEARARHISPERLIFAERMVERERHLARLGLADLYLDTLPYNAHSTASEMLWMGVPPITCMGRSFAARIAGSMLTSIGMEELIARELADYEAMALDLARSPERLSALREKLAANRLSSPLFDMARLARHVESAYEIMWKRHIEGQPPAGFDVPSL